jgi:hypothetical protein
MRLAPTELTFVSKFRSVLPGDVLASRVLVSAFWHYRVSLQRKKCCQQIIGLNDESVFRAVRSPKLLLKERQVFSSRISIARWKRWERLSKSVVRTAAANSNKGLLIGIWPRITSGFTSNCSAGHLLKRQLRVASCDAPTLSRNLVLACSYCNTRSHAAAVRFLSIDRKNDRTDN